MTDYHKKITLRSKVTILIKRHFLFAFRLGGIANILSKYNTLSKNKFNQWKFWRTLSILWRNINSLHNRTVLSHNLVNIVHTHTETYLKNLQFQNRWRRIFKYIVIRYIYSELLIIWTMVDNSDKSKLLVWILSIH